jgi:hypothetical protein
MRTILVRQSAHFLTYYLLRTKRFQVNRAKGSERSLSWSHCSRHFHNHRIFLIAPLEEREPQGQFRKDSLKYKERVQKRFLPRFT